MSNHLRLAPDHWMVFDLRTGAVTARGGPDDPPPPLALGESFVRNVSGEDTDVFCCRSCANVHMRYEYGAQWADLAS